MKSFFLLFAVCSLAKAGDVFALRQVVEGASINVPRLKALFEKESKANAVLIQDGIPDWVTIEDIRNVFRAPLPGKGKIVFFVKSFNLVKDAPDGYIKGINHIILVMEFNERDEFLRGFSFPFEYAGMSPLSQVFKIAPDVKNLHKMQSADLLDPQGASYSIDGRLDQFDLKIKRVGE